MSTELKGHTAPVSAVAWDPTHSDKLASCGQDGTVKFWDYRVKSCLATVVVGGDLIAIAWHPDGGTVAVAGKVRSAASSRESSADGLARMRACISFQLRRTLGPRPTRYQRLCTRSYSRIRGIRC